MRILLMADIHIGSIKDIKYFYNTMKDIIDREIMFKKTDVVVILGDYFDRLFKNNEDFTALAINIMSYLVIACTRNNTKIRIIYGTESHEMNQYRLFNFHLISKNVDMKIFETVTEEEIDGKKILYVPEEYIDDKSKHYKKYLYNNNYYDFIFGHGVIEDGMPEIISYGNNKSNKEKHVPRFKSGEFAKISDVCIFGHYHQFTNICECVFYLGSLFRDSFGEEIDKCYCIISDDDSIKNDDSYSNIFPVVDTYDCNKYKVTFIKNTKAYLLLTLNFDPTSDIYLSNDAIINEIHKIKKEYSNLFDGSIAGKIRLKFNTPNNLDPKFRETLKSILFDEKFISTTIKELNDEIVSELGEDDEDKENDFVLDISLSIIDKIYRFAEKKYEHKITMEKLNKYLSKSLAQISAKKKLEENEEEEV